MNSLSPRLDKTDKSRTAALEQGGVSSNSPVAGYVGGTRGRGSSGNLLSNPCSRGPSWIPK
eukprot:8063075-Pyramimonas_sp.AAC.1